MSRRMARENIFKLVFEYLFSGEENELSLESALGGIDYDDQNYISSLYRTVLANNNKISELIKKHSRDFSYERIYKVDLAILYVALTEILFEGIPYQVSINEAVELAKKYSTEKSPTYINGVLAGIVSEIGEKK